MVGNYICEKCLKSFKTNQHLTQHKNRKRKCIPQKMDSPGSSLENSSVSSSLEDSLGPMPPLIHKHPFLYNEQLKTTPNYGNDGSFKNMMDLIMSYKVLLDTNKMLEFKMNAVESRLIQLTNENNLLKKKVKIAEDFINAFNENIDDKPDEDEDNNNCYNYNNDDDKNKGFILHDFLR